MFKQKGRKIPIRLQDAVKTEMNKIIEFRPFENIQEMGEHMCLCPTVIAKKSDLTVKIALHAKILSENFIVKTNSIVRCVRDWTI